VTGSVPFPGTTREQIAESARQGLPDPDPRCANLPRALEELVRSGLTADSKKRPCLSEFITALRGVLNHLLADSLLSGNLDGVKESPSESPMSLRLTVSRQIDRERFVPVATTRPVPERFVRDFRRVPPQPESATVHTGDRVRIQVETNLPGYITVFNVGPTGNLNLLHPAGLREPGLLTAHRPLRLLDIELTPPVGRERLFALWTRDPLTLRREDLLSLAEKGEFSGLGPSRATRDMARVQNALQQLPPGSRHAAVLELNHQPRLEAGGRN
jgi:hypothetical protein